MRDDHRLKCPISFDSIYIHRHILFNVLAQDGEILAGSKLFYGSDMVYAVMKHSGGHRKWDDLVMAEYQQLGFQLFGISFHRKIPSSTHQFH